MIQPNRNGNTSCHHLTNQMATRCKTGHHTAKQKRQYKLSSLNQSAWLTLTAAGVWCTSDTRCSMSVCPSPGTEPDTATPAWDKSWLDLYPLTAYTCTHSQTTPPNTHAHHHTHTHTHNNAKLCRGGICNRVALPSIMTMLWCTYIYFLDWYCRIVHIVVFYFGLVFALFFMCEMTV